MFSVEILEEARIERIEKRFVRILLKVLIASRVERIIKEHGEGKCSLCYAAKADLSVSDFLAELASKGTFFFSMVFENLK